MFEVVDMTIVFVYLGLFFGISASILGAYAVMSIRKINKNSEIIFSGKEVSSLEELMLSNSKSIAQMDKEIQELFEISNKIHNLSFNGLHKIGIVRFNPFKDIGGNQSFAIAILDGKNSGLIMSSLHTREGGTRIYAKPIKNGKCEEYDLTEEEIKAISSAMAKKRKLYNNSTV